MQSKNERDSCKDRPNGFYETRVLGRDFETSQFTDYGWITPWSSWFQNDSDFEEIREEIREENARTKHGQIGFQ